MTRSASSVLLVIAALAGTIAVANSARADGYPPFYGYSPYLGRPTVYFTPESDVQQATTQRTSGFDVRTYYRGGPFWRYEPVGSRRGASRSSRPRRHMAVLRRRG